MTLKAASHVTGTSYWVINDARVKVNGASFPSNRITEYEEGRKFNISLNQNFTAEPSLDK